MTKKVDYKIISAKDFIKAKPSGEMDLEQSKKMLGKIATIAEPPADYEILLDIRQAYGNLTFINVYGLVMELGKHRSAFRNKIAVLSRDDHQFDNAQFMELCAKNRGFQVAAFINFEDAIDWFSTCTKVEK